jgi:hypothetical protein
MSTGSCSRAAGIIVFAYAISGCGAHGGRLEPSSDASVDSGEGGAAGGGGSAGSDASAGSGGVAGAGGGSTTCEPACSGTTPVCVKGKCAECVPGNLKCLDEKTPQTCDDTGTWKTETPCGGAEPICNGGTCGGVRLRGGIGTLGPYGAPAGTVRLRTGALELAPRLCADNVCVTGGIKP